MKKIILHIGFGKTGSSYLQYCLATQADKLLAEAGIFYPDAPNTKAARAGKITSGNGIRLAKYLNPNNILNVDITDYQDEFTEFLKQPEYDTILFSSEFLANFNPELMAAFKQDVEALGYELHLICYIRSIAGHAYSQYSQKVKRHLYTESFYHYLENDYGVPFRGLLKRINNCFPEMNYTIRNYDLVRDQLWEDFLQSLAPTKDLSCLHMDGEQRIVNRSLSSYELDFMRVFNRYLDNQKHAIQVSDALIYGSEDNVTEYILESDEVELIKNRFGDMLKAVNQFCAPERQIDLLSNEFVVGTRTSHAIDDFQRSVISILAALLRKG